MKITEDQKDQILETVQTDGWKVMRQLIEVCLKEHKDLVEHARIDVGSRDLTLKRAKLDGVKVIEKLVRDAEMLSRRGSD